MALKDAISVLKEFTGGSVILPSRLLTASVGVKALQRLERQDKK